MPRAVPPSLPPETPADHLRNALAIIAAQPDDPPLPDWTAGVVSRIWYALQLLEADCPQRQNPPPIIGDGPPTIWIG